MLDAMKEHSSHEFSVIYRKKLPLLKKDQEHSNQEFSRYLPVEYNYHNSSKLINWLLRIINLFTNKHKLHKLIKKYNPDIIHFNSLVLIPLIDYVINHPDFKNLKIVCHVRESINDSFNKKYKNTLSKINAYICIDSITKRNLLKIYPYLKNTKITILPNLIEYSLQKQGPSDRKIKTFGYVGILNSDKGALFIAKVFKSMAVSDTILLILGNGFTLDHLRLKLLAINCRNIIILGFKKNLLQTKIYDSIDVIIRGESEFVGLGRSGFEAIVHRKILVLPNTKDYLPLTMLSDESPIQLYEARNLESLKALILSLYNKSLKNFNFSIMESHNSQLWSANPEYYSDKLFMLYNSLDQEFK